MMLTFFRIPFPLKEAHTCRTSLVHLAACIEGSRISSLKCHNHSPKSDEEPRVRKVKGGCEATQLESGGIGLGTHALSTPVYLERTA